MNYNVLKESIMAVIKANGNEEITGDLLQQVLLAMTNALGVGYQFVGVAVPTTNPGITDARIYYVATQAGSYNNFTNPAITLDGTQLAILKYDTAWSAIILDVPTKAYVDTALGEKVDKIEGMGLSTNDLTDELKALIEGAFQAENVAQELGDSTTKVISQDAITRILLGYAKVDGYYGRMTVGAAENLVGRGSVPADYTFRTSGGSADIGTGAAQITKIKGKTIAWNQLANGEFRTNMMNILSFDNATQTYTVVTSPGATSITDAYYIQALGSIILQHSVLIRLRFTPSANCTILWSTNGYGADANPKEFSLVGGRENFVERVVPYTTRYQWFSFPGAEVGTTIKAEGFEIYDLTLSTLASEVNTPEKFKALYPGIYGYNAGKLKNNDALAVETTGFNRYNPETGKAQLILLPTSANGYQITGAYSALSFTGISGEVSTITPDASGYFNVSEPGELSVTGGDSSTTCVHIVWSGYRDGEFEPYWHSVLQLGLNALACHDESDNAVVVNGLDGVGSSYDEGVVENGMLTKIIKRRARINLGNLSYQKIEGSGIYGFWGAFDGASGASIYAITTAGYTPVLVSWYTMADKQMRLSSSVSTVKGVVIRDDSYTDAATFKTAMNGVYLDYELATPVVLTLDTPIPVSYRVDDFGTEERIAPVDADGAQSAPIVYDVQYAMNAVDTLRRLPENYISVQSFTNFCTELADKLGAALDKTITITPTYNSESMEYDFDITIADIPEQEP